MANPFDNLPTFEEESHEKETPMVIMSADEIAELNKEFTEEEEEEDDFLQPIVDDDEEEEEESGKDKPTPEKDPIASGVYKSLVERGIFKEEEEFDGTFDTLEKYFDDLPTQTRENILNDAPPVGKELVEFILKGGHTLSNDDIFTFVNKYHTATGDVTVSSVDDAESIVSAELTKLGFDEEQIELNIDLMKSKGDQVLIDQAKAYQERNKPKLDEDIAAVERNRIADENSAREFTKSVFDTLEATPYNKQRKEEIKNAIRSDKITDILVEAVSNPQSLIQLANLVLHYKKDKGFDLTEFAKQVASKDIKALKDKSFSDNFSTVGSGQHRDRVGKDRYSNVEFVTP